MPAWLIFLLSAVVVVLAGSRLATAGDTIADRTGLGRAWVGAILIAGATSLPELTTDIYAVRQGTADLALGDLFGSSMANMLILAIADLVLIRQRVLSRVAINQALVGVLAIALTVTAIAGVLTDDRVQVLGFGWAPIVIGFSYVAGMRMLHQNRAGPPFATSAETEEAARQAPGLRRAIVTFVIAAALILFAARYLADSAAALADQLGITTGFVGIALLAMTTSLPEVAVTFASVRSGSYDLAVGNLLGSNCFNIVIILVLDGVNGAAPLLSGAGPDVLIGGVFAILLTAQSVIEVLNKSERRAWVLEPDALARIATYLFGVYLISQVGG